MGMRRRDRACAFPIPIRTRQQWQLPNGIRLVTEYIPSAYSVAIGVWVLAGSRDEEAAHNGIAHLVEHLVSGASQRRNAQQLATHFERLAAELHAYTTKESTCYAVQTLRPYVPQVLHLLAELLQHPRITRQAVARERRIILDELLASADDPEEVLYDHAERVLFRAHPLALPIAGTPETVSHLTEDIATAFHARFYVGEAMLITVAGNIAPEEVYELVSETFASIPQRRQALPVRLPPETEQTQEVTLHRHLHQAYVLCARLLPKLALPDRVALAIVDFILGEGWGSRLYQCIRERSGLAYTIFSELEWFSDCGVWNIALHATTSALPTIERLIRHELQRLSEEGLSKPELARARRFLQARLAMALDNPMECIALLARAATEHIPDPFTSTLHLLDELPCDTINALAARFCNPEQWSWIRLLPYNHG